MGFGLHRREIMKLDFCATGTVGKDPWYSNGDIMLKGVPSQKPDRTSVKMDTVFKEATSELTLAKHFKREYYGPPKIGCHVMVESSTGTIIQEKYFKMVHRKGWKLFVGGVICGGVICGTSGERYIVAKKGDEVMAIVAPMRKVSGNS